MNGRTNDEWIEALNEPGSQRGQALDVLRDYLLRVVLVYLRERREDVAGWTETDIRHFAEDRVQEALWAIQENLDGFRGDAKFTTWAYRFVVNAAATELRLSRYGEISLESLQEQESSILHTVLRDDQGVDPDLASERRDILAEIDLIIRDELTERQQRAVVGVHFQQLPMEVVARELGIDRNALYKLMYDARKRIKERLRARRWSVGDILALFES